MILPRAAHPARRAAAVAATVGALALGLVPTGARPAAAHGGDGTMALVSATRAGAGDDVSLLVRLTYVDDGHGVPDATVTAVVDRLVGVSTRASAIAVSRVLGAAGWTVTILPAWISTRVLGRSTLPTAPGSDDSAWRPTDA